MLNDLRARVAQLIAPSKNSMSLPNQFLRNGGRSTHANWGEVILSDRDFYTGYSYAAIRNRANTVARIASEHVRTETKNKENDYHHPYLEAIWNAPTFSEFSFWSEISTYLDLRGVYYLMVVRNSDGNRYGTIQKMVLLNPYEIRRVLDPDTLQPKGYVETRDGMVREIPPSMIIEMREMNPWSREESFSMKDAARDSQFTLRTSGEHTRSAIRNDINAPGIISTDVILEDEQFQNFMDRIKNHTKGEPLFGNGSGAITYEAMTKDLSKSALKDVNEINRDELFATAGVSKTMMGIEQSGTTRETAKVQKDLYIEGQILPRIQLIIDALNLDYRNKYPKEYAQKEAYLMAYNPLGSDHDAELKEAEAKEKKFKVYTALRANGYSDDIAGQYVEGEIDISQLGEPTEEVKTLVEEDDSKKKK